jgi:trigger factor
VFNVYANNAQALIELGAPIFEDKVVDFIAELAEVNDRTVDRETLFMDPDEAREKLDGAGDANAAKKEKKPRKSAE